ncbi:MAG: molybdenum ABC transporter ATP-binding protein, partial [Betaproteobacteria bacterium]|nr:molybdenum ABC transporter ATP-binding protein [Betaproteobacteria bacterium]
MHEELSISFLFLYVPHTMEELTRLADHVVRLELGQAKIQGPISEGLGSATIASIVGGKAGVVLVGVVKQHDQAYHLSCVDLDGSSLWVRQRPLEIGRRVRVQIHANDASLSTREPEGTSRPASKPPPAL